MSVVYTKEEFLQDCRTVFENTDGNTADIPGIGKVVMYEAPLVGFGRAEVGVPCERKAPGRKTV